MGKQEKLSLQPPAKAVEQVWTPEEIFEAVSSDITIIERFKEDRRVERKSARIQPRDLGDYLTVYANRQPDGGVIFVGVSNDGAIEGCKSLGDKGLNDIERAGSVYCPDTRILSKSVEAYNTSGQLDFILAMRVFYNSSKLVETSSKEAYTREGSSKRRLSEVEKREIRIKKGEIDYEREDVSLSWPDDFDQDLAAEYARNYSAARQLTRSQAVEVVLINTRLGRRVDGRFQPNVACALLFARDPRLLFPGAYIRVMRFVGKHERTGDRYNLIDGKDFWIEGPLPRQIAKADEVIGGEVRKFTRLGVDGKFQTSAEFPKDAWLEAVVNAVAHRSYNLRNMVTSVKMFDDRIVIENPGGFYPPTTAATIAEIGHNPRNPHMMAALFYFDIVKCAHEGTRRMRESMTEASLPAPEFSQVDSDGNIVRVVLRNEFEHRKTFIDASVEVPFTAELYTSLTERERTIVNYLAEHQEMNITGASRILSVHWNTAKKVIETLIKKDICEYVRLRQRERDPSLKVRLKR